MVILSCTLLNGVKKENPRDYSGWFVSPILWGGDSVLAPFSLFCLLTWLDFKIRLRRIYKNDPPVEEDDTGALSVTDPPSDNEACVSGCNAHLSHLFRGPYRLLDNVRRQQRAEGEMVMRDFYIACRNAGGSEVSAAMRQVALCRRRQSAYSRHVATRTCSSSDRTGRGVGSVIGGSTIMGCIPSIKNRRKEMKPPDVGPDALGVAAAHHSHHGLPKLAAPVRSRNMNSKSSPNSDASDLIDRGDPAAHKIPN